MIPDAVDVNAMSSQQKLSAQKEADPDKLDEASAGEALDVVLDATKERKLLLKLDLAFVPIIMLTYLSCFLDRSNIGNVSPFLDGISQTH